MTTPELKYDAFISYSRADVVFAKKLEQALESYKAPKALTSGPRRLRVFRDESDFTGVDYQQAVREHLASSASLIVICSPSARASTYVDEEIREFALHHGAGRIVPVLLSGIPNNEVETGQEAQRAFPDALCEQLGIPLATDYRGFDVRRDRVNRDPFLDKWATLLANLYGVSREQIEQRERKARVSRQRIVVGASASIIALLSVALILTIQSQREAQRQAELALEAAKAEAAARDAEAEQRKFADEQARIAEERGREAVQAAKAERDARLMSEARSYAARSLSLADTNPVAALVLAVESGTIMETVEAWQALDKSMSTARETLAFRDVLSRAEPSVSPDGSSVLLVNRAGTAEVRNLNDGGLSFRLQDAPTPITAASFSISGRHVFTVGGEFLSRYNGGTGFLEKSWRLPVRKQDGYNWLLPSPNERHVLASGYQASITVHDTLTETSWSATGKSWFESNMALDVYLEPVPPTEPRSFFVEGGKRFAISTLRGGLAIVDTISGDLVQQLGEPPPNASSLPGLLKRASMSPSGQQVMLNSWWQGPRVIDVRTNQAFTLDTGESNTYAAAFDPSGEFIATGSRDGRTRIFSATSGDQISSINAHAGSVWAIGYSLDGQKLVTGGADGNIQLIDVMSGRIDISLRGHNADIWSVRFLSDGDRILSAGEDGFARLFDLRLGPELRSVEVFEPSGSSYGSRFAALFGAAFNIVILSNGRGEATAFDVNRGTKLWSIPSLNETQLSESGNIVLAKTPEAMAAFDAVDGSKLSEFKGTPIPGGVSPDGSRVAVRASRSGITVIEPRSGSIQYSIEEDRLIGSVAFDPRNRWLVTAGSRDGNRMRRYSADDGRFLHEFGNRYVDRVTFSRDGSKLLTRTERETDDEMRRIEDSSRVELIDSLTGRADWSYAGGEKWIRASGFSPDERYVVLLVGHEKGCAVLLTTSDATVAGEFCTPQDTIGQARVSADSRLVAVSDEYGRTVVYGVASGEALRILRGEAISTATIGISPDNRYLVRLDHSGTADIYAIRFSELVDQAKSRIPLTLTADERRRIVE